MKKLFSYLLISSMVVLSSCTNYDDQFDDLNSQINSLKSQIEGFSGLSSGLTALQGTVSALQTAVAALPKTATPATDISGLEASVAALQTSLASASTSAEVAAITTQLTAAQAALATAIAANGTASDANATNITALQTSLEAVQATLAALQTTLASASTTADITTLTAELDKVKTDLGELLAINNVYTPTENSGILQIQTKAQLDFAKTLGNRLSIINGGVDVVQTTDMSATDLAAVLAKFKTVTKNVDYVAKATGVVPTAGFVNLSSTTNLTVEINGDISFPELASAGVVTLKENSKTTSISMPKLASATSIGSTIGAANSLTLAKVTSVDFGSLVRYGQAWTIDILKGNVDLASLGNTPATGSTETTNTLTLEDVDTVDLSARTAGTIMADDLDAVSLPKWKGTSDSSFDGAKTVSLPAIAGAVTLDIDLNFKKAETFSVTAAGKLTAPTVTSYPSVTMSVAQNNLVSVTLAGDYNEIDIDGASDLTSVVISGKATNVTVANTDVATLDLTYTTHVAVAKAAVKLTINNNDSLTSLTADKVNGVDSLIITGNDALASVSMAALAKVGATTNAVAQITDNDLTIDSIQDKSALPTTIPQVAFAIKSADFAPLETYLAAAKKAAGTTGKVIVTAKNVTTAFTELGVERAVTLSTDKIIANWDPKAAADLDTSEGSTAQVQEMLITVLAANVYSSTAATTGTYFTIADADGNSIGFQSPIITDSGADLYFDVKNWASSATKSLFSDAGLTMSVGKGRYQGSNTFTTALTGTVYYTTTNVEGKPVTYTTSGGTSNLAANVVEAIHNKISGLGVSYKAFSSTRSSNVLTIKGYKRGSLATAPTVPSISAYLDAAGASPASDTHFTNTVVAPARITTEAYIQFISDKGIANALTAVKNGGTIDNLAISGTDATASGTGDDELAIAKATNTVPNSDATELQIKAQKVDNIAALTS